MRVNSQNYGSSVQGPETANAKQAEQTAKAKAALDAEKTKSTGDVDVAPASAEISDRAREMAQAKAVATSAPDIREAKIAELKKRIAAKQYNVKPEDVADKMVREHIQAKAKS